jgi:hypothetical protein
MHERHSLAANSSRRLPHASVVYQQLPVAAEWFRCGGVRTVAAAGCGRRRAAWDPIPFSCETHATGFAPGRLSASQSVSRRLSVWQVSAVGVGAGLLIEARALEVMAAAVVRVSSFGLVFSPKTRLW